MPDPALCPEHALQLALPSTGRLPSTVSAADVTRHCSRLPQYYAAVRLLVRVHAHRAAIAFMGRSGALTGHERGLPGSAQRTSPRAWGHRQREAPRPQAIYAGRMLPSLQENEIGTSEFDPFRCSIPSPWHPLIAVGTRVTPRHPHRSVRAPLRHTAPTLGGNGEANARPGMKDSGLREKVIGQPYHPLP